MPTIDFMSVVRNAGKKLVELIPNAEIIWLDGVGHIFPFPNMGAVITKVIENMSAPTTASI